ncbi:MAG: alpha/beta fold hydrolase [Pseudomonadota bacterium]
MKTRSPFLALLVMLLAAPAITAEPATAPAPIPGKGLVGTWLGALTVNAGMKLRLELTVTEADGKLSAILNSIDQNAKIPASSVSATAETAEFECATINGKFEGRFSADGSEIVGTWSQGGGSMPLTLRRQAAPFVLKRPQEPAKPYPYREEEVAFPNKAAGISLAGTLTLPQGKGPFGAVVLMSGSGPQDRDEALLGHKPFLILADHLTRAGIAVLRYDDRGVGKSTGSFGTATHLDFAADGRAAFDYLQTRPEIDRKHIGLLGHSEGSVYAPLIVRDEPGVAYVVFLAGVGVPVRELLERQSQDIVTASGLKYERTPALKAIDDAIYERLRTSTNDAELLDFVRAKLKEGLALLPDDLKKAMGIDEANIEPRVRMMVSPAFVQLSQYDPRATLPAIKCPVLALFGTKDRQVAAEPNSEGMKATFAKSGNRQVTLKTFDGLNHLFQHATTGAPSEYANIEETMAPEVLASVATWINKQL